MKKWFLIPLLWVVSLDAAWYTNPSSTSVLATGGELSAWSHDSQFSSGFTGINDVPYKRIIQDGNITDFIADIAVAGGANGIVFKVFTPNASTGVFTWKADSPAFTVSSTGVQVFTLVTPIAANVQDVVAAFPENGTQIWQTNVASCASYTICRVPFIAGNQSATFTPATFNNNVSLNVAAKMLPEFTIMGGDSIGEGYQPPPVPPGHYAYYDGELGDVPTQSIWKVQQLASPTGFQYQNHSAGGQTWAFVASTEVPVALTRSPVNFILHCGINDITSGRTWTQIQANLDTIRGLLPAGVHVFLREILPSSAAASSTILAMNVNYANYAATWNSQFTLVPVFAAMSDGMGNINPALFVSDGIHPNQAGQYVLANIDEPILAAFYNTVVPPTTTKLGAIGDGIH